MNGKKKIWILNHYANPPYVGGGTRHYDLGEELTARGYQVKIFSSGFNHQLRVSELKPGERIKKEVIHGVEFIRLKTFPYQQNDLRRIINMFSFALILFFAGLQERRPDIIIASSPHPLTCLAGFLLARLKNARFVAEMRDLWPQTFIDMGVMKESGIAAKVLRGIEKFIFQKAEKIIVLLPHAAHYIKSTGVEEGKVIYIPNGISVKKYNQAIKTKGETHDIAQILIRHRDKFKVLYLGAHGQANALNYILDAAKILKEKACREIDILLVGDGPEKENLVEKSRDEGLDNVFFYRPVPKTDVPLLTSSVDVCLFHLADVDVFKYGISPNKLFDYLCAAKPVVFACNTPKDPVTAAGCGLVVPPENPQAMAEAILKINHLSSTRRQQLGAKGREYVKQFHDIPILADILEQTF